MPDLHVIIGDSNTRKSSLLRCLTGVGSGNATRYIDVARASGGVITVYCMLSALQENYKPKSPAEFIKYVHSLNPSPTDIAFTLRVSATGTFPTANVYLQAFSQAGWQIANVALLGSAACKLQTTVPCRNICAVPMSPTHPTNQTADQVRKVWQWL